MHSPGGGSSQAHHHHTVVEESGTRTPNGKPKTQQERNRIRAIRRRQRETSQERIQRREVERLRAANRRQNESPAESEVRRQKGRLRAMRRRENESEDEKKRRRELNRIRMAERRRELKTIIPSGCLQKRESGDKDSGGTVVERKRGNGSEQIHESDTCSERRDTLSPGPRPSLDNPVTSATAANTRKRRSNDTGEEDDAPLIEHMSPPPPPLPLSRTKQTTTTATAQQVRRSNKQPSKTQAPAKTPLTAKSHRQTVAIGSLMSDTNTSSIMKTLGSTGIGYSSAAQAPPVATTSSTLGTTTGYQQGYKQPMLPQPITITNVAAAVAAAAAAAAVSTQAPPQFTLSHTQNAMHSLVSNSLAIQKQAAANIGMMFPAPPPPQQQRLAPVHHGTTGLGIGTAMAAASSAASFAPGLVVGPLGTFTQPPSLGQTSIMAAAASYASQPIDGSSITPSSATLPQRPQPHGYHQPPMQTTIQGMRTIAPILSPSGRSQFRYSAPQPARTQLQETGETMLGLAMAGSGGPSGPAILHTQATAETMAAAAAVAAAATASSNPTDIAPIGRFQTPSTLQRHSINNQHHYPQIPYYHQSSQH